LLEFPCELLTTPFIYRTNYLANSFLYALATFDSIHPAALYLRLSGNPDNILTWRLYSNIHFDDNNKMAQASTIAPQEGIYDDDVEQGSSNDHLAEAKA
jgi:hypothetical protein